LLRDGGC